MTDSRIRADRLTRCRALASLGAVVAPLASRGVGSEGALPRVGAPRERFLRSEDIDAVSDVARRQPGPVVDLEPVFGRPPSLAFLRKDGLHPSLAGRQAIARAVVERFATPA